MKLTPDAKGTDEARQYLVAIMRSEMGNDCYSNYIRQELAGDFAWNLVNYLLSPDVARDARPITDLATIVKAAYGNKAWISERNDIPSFLSPTSADYADLKADGAKRSSWHPDFVVALYENSNPDKMYTMDQMREYADAFHRSRIDAARPAQTRALTDAELTTLIRKVEDKLGIVWFVPDDSERYAWRTTDTNERLKYARALLTAARPASGETE